MLRSFLSRSRMTTPVLLFASCFGKDTNKKGWMCYHRSFTSKFYNFTHSLMCHREGPRLDGRWSHVSNRRALPTLFQSRESCTTPSVYPFLVPIPMTHVCIETGVQAMLFLSHAYLGWTPWFGFFLRFAPSPWSCSWLFLTGVSTCAILVLPCGALRHPLVPLGVDRRCERRSSIEWDGARAVVFRGVGVGQTTCVCVCVCERERQGGTIRWVSFLSLVSFSPPPPFDGFRFWVPKEWTDPDAFLSKGEVWVRSKGDRTTFGAATTRREGAWTRRWRNVTWTWSGGDEVEREGRKRKRERNRNERRRGDRIRRRAHAAAGHRVGFGTTSRTTRAREMRGNARVD